MKEMIKITGIVIHGNKRGRIIGYPTANIAPSKEILTEIGDGTYGGDVVWRDEEYLGALFVSLDKDLLEVHILGFDKEIYGEEIVVTIGERIRDNKKFDSVEALKMQIKKDIAIIKSIKVKE